MHSKRGFDSDIEGAMQTDLELLVHTRRTLAMRFSESELRTLCFDLGVDYEDLGGQDKASKSRELVAYLERRSRIGDLVGVGKKQRPDIDWGFLNPINTGNVSDNDNNGSAFQNTPRRLRVFLCHSSSNKPAVRNLYRRLRSEGVDPWLDEENILPGQDWQREIAKAIRVSDIVIVCLSQESVTRTGYVQRELKYALDVADQHPDDAIFIIPLKLEDCTVPDRLTRWHWVNLYDDRGFERLILALRARASTLGVVATPTATRADISHRYTNTEVAFLTFDSTPLLQQNGQEWQAPYELYPSVADLLNDVYMTLNDVVPPFTYETDWVLQDRDTMHIFYDIGTKWSEKYINSRWDNRSLQAVGIRAGMYLRIIPLPNRK